MSQLSEQIIKLKSQGLTYNQIKSKLNCSLSTISYHLNINGKKNNQKRTRKLRAKHPYIRKCYCFCNMRKVKSHTDTYKTNSKKLIQNKIRNFHFNRNTKMYESIKFTYQDVINKFGENPVCYLTGTPIDIHNTKEYEFDHIIPATRGGTNELDNLGICTKAANQAKRDMTPDEFINLCKQVVKHNQSGG